MTLLAESADAERSVKRGNVITSTVTVDAVEELGLDVGKPVNAIIKASEVILGVDD